MHAIGLIESTSIAKGVEIADTMVKTADVEILVAKSICPGKYIVLVGGDVAAVRPELGGGPRPPRDRSGRLRGRPRRDRSRGGRTRQPDPARSLGARRPEPDHFGRARPDVVAGDRRQEQERRGEPGGRRQVFR